MSSGILNRFTIVQGFDSDSASRTDIWEATDNVTGMPCIFKVFVSDFFSTNMSTGKDSRETPMTVSGLSHELNVYKAARKYLVEDPNVNCRNVLCIVGEGSFTAMELLQTLKTHTSLTVPNIKYNIYRNTLFLLRLKDKPRYAITRVVQNPSQLRMSNLHIDIENGAYRIRLDLPITYHCMITPKIDRMSLEDGIFQGKVDLQACMRYLFIIFVTLLLMSAVGLNQNDLHWSNILLSASYAGPSPRHKKNYFIVFNNELILIDNPFIPIVYDFDRASMQNRRVESLEERQDVYSVGGNCPQYHPKRDFVKTLCCVYHYCNTLRKIIPGEGMQIKQIQNEIMNELIQSDSIRAAILNSSEACWMSTEDDTSSLLCFDKKLIRDVASRNRLIKWCADKCNYQKCTLQELADVARTREASPSFRNVMQMCKVFAKDMTPEHWATPAETKAVIRTNIQVVNYNQKFNVTTSRTQLYARLTEQLFSILSR